jgi:hypothetical protein
MKILSKPRKPGVAPPLRLSSNHMIHKQRGSRFFIKTVIVDLRNYQHELEIQNKANALQPDCSEEVWWF